MSETITINLVDAGEEITVYLNEAARGPVGQTGSDATVTNANVNSAIEDNPTATQTSIGLEPSTTGGVSKVLKTDSSGDIQTGSYSNSGALGVGGNINIPQFRGLSFRDSSGTQGAIIYLCPNHTASYDELIFDTTGSHCFYWVTAMQLGSADGGNHYIYRHSGYASAGTTMRQSVPDAYNTMTWTDGASVLNRMAIQAAPLDLSGTNSAFQFFQNTTLGSAQAVNGTKIAEIAAAGVWSAGTAPAFDQLTDGATITQTASIYKTVQSATVTLGGNRALAISGAASGMRGVIYVTQDATGSRTLTPAGGSALDLSTTAGATDRVTWEFDGTYYNFTTQKAIQREVVVSDSDAAAFITAASITSTSQKVAISNLVSGLKASNVSGTGTLWSKFYAIYPFIGGNATAHSKELKAAYNGTFAGSPTHDSNGITGDGTGAYFNTGFALSAVSALNSVFAHVQCKTASPTDARYLFGATAADNARLGLYRTSASIGKAGINANDLSGAYGVSSAFNKHFFQNRSASNAQQFGDSVSYSTDTVASLSACSQPIYVLARNQKGTADNFTNANISFAAFGQSLDVTERAAYFAIVTAFQTELGR